MSEKYTKAAISAALGGLSAYLGILGVPIFILMAVMVIDYASGMVKAWERAELSSKTGIKGIVKKVCYLLVVAVAAVVDWLIYTACDKLGVDIGSSMYMGMIVTVWLIINECISILENLAVIGVPLPSFLTKAVEKLRVAVEKGRNKLNDNNNDKEDNDNDL